MEKVFRGVGSVFLMLFLTAAASAEVVSHYSAGGSGDTTAFEARWTMDGTSVENVGGEPAVVFDDGGRLYIRGIPERVDSIRTTFAGEGNMTVNIAAVEDDPTNPLTVDRLGYGDAGEKVTRIDFEGLTGINSYNMQYVNNADEALAVRESVFVAESGENGGDAEPAAGTGTGAEQERVSRGFISGIMKFFAGLF